MKKFISLLLLCCFIFAYGSVYINCETYDYAFDSIKIVEAMKFSITVDNEPDESSYLYSRAKTGDVITVYVGVLEMVSEGVSQTGASRIIILTDVNNNDLLKWIVNSGSWTAVTELLEFSSHIQIAPEYGIRKDLTVPPIQVGLKRDLSTGKCAFIDNTGVEYPMDQGSYELKEGLDILIAAHTEVAD